MKKQKINKSYLIKTVSLGVTLVTILGGGCLYFYNQAKNYKLALENTYKHSLQDFNDYINNIYNDLDKGLYAGTAYQLSNISAKLLSDSRAAIMCLSSLPEARLHVDNTFKFLSQVGSYAAALNKKYHAQNEISDEEYQSLASLKNYAKKLNSYVSNLENKVLKNNLEFSNLKNKKNNNKNIDISDLENIFEDYPKMIYDGPFSDNIYNKTPELTKNQTEISSEQAKKIAAIATGIDQNKLSQSEDENSNIELYCFRAKNISIGVTKKGGNICYILKSKEIKKQLIDAGVAIENAKKYINNILKITDIEQSYYEINNNCCVINFVCKQDDIIIYPDLIKISVALDNGEMISVDARKYISNHKDREINKSKKTEKEAQEKLSKNLEILKDPRRAIIPTDGENEVVTYEFVCRGSDDEIVIVYINSDNLEEEQILVLSESENGILVV
ncbi:MAG: germination protein YpeB [Oscillospiraceae bacterium]|nr:germination protein YpeB [Oscillospiraceae bacterium]